MYLFTMVGSFNQGRDNPDDCWDDFRFVDCANGHDGPRATIVLEPKKVPDGKEFCIRLNNDGWYDIYVREFNMEVVKKVLAVICFTTPDEVNIHENAPLDNPPDTISPSFML